VTYISEGSPVCSTVRAHTNLGAVKYTKALFYVRNAPFLINAPYQFTLLNLAPPIFGLTLCDVYFHSYKSFYS